MKSQGQTWVGPGLFEGQSVAVEPLALPLHAACPQDESSVEERLQEPQPRPTLVQSKPSQYLGLWPVRPHHAQHIRLMHVPSQAHQTRRYEIAHLGGRPFTRNVSDVEIKFDNFSSQRAWRPDKPFWVSTCSRLLISYPGKIASFPQASVITQIRSAPSP